MLFGKGQKICTGFSHKINSVIIGWKTLYVACNGFFSTCRRQMLPRSLSACFPVLSGVSTGWRREGDRLQKGDLQKQQKGRWSPSVLELLRTSDSYEEVVKEVALLHPISPVVFNNQKVVPGSGEASFCGYS